jgi:4-amino-4-deoxy-L-arabinose transferase-like glycosyltransferase
MTAAAFVFSARTRFERLFDALTDPARCERTMLVVLAGYLAVWSLYASVAKSSQDIHTDMGEMVAWSHDAGLGTPKHPPLAAWLVRVWFEVFPHRDWAYYVFAILLATVALWVAWRLSARYLPPDKRVAGIALLTLVPFYNFHAIKFNANTVLTPFWALTTWWFLRSFESRRVGWSALTGIAAAAAMLGKYWSVTLLSGLGLAGLSDPRRSAYFNSLAPYVTLAVGTMLLTPHVDYLITHQFVPFDYAMQAHPATFATAALSALYFIGAGLCYIAAPVVLTLLAARPGAAAVADTVWPGDPERRTLVVAFAAPFAIAVLIALVVIVEIESLWAMSMMTLLPVVLLSSPQLTLPRRAAVGFLALAMIFPMLMLASAPLSAIYDHRNGVPNYASDYRLVAQAVERAWRARTARPLRIIGSVNFVNGIVFYFADQPATFEINAPATTPWVSDDRIRRDGIAIVCPEPEPFCMRALRSYAERYHAVADEHIVVSRRFLGTAGKPQRYEIVIILPQQS